MYKPIIGLEIHCELKTQSKMFCGCANNSDETRANFNVCPICLGHPGTLPVINQEAVKSVLKLGLALNGKIPVVSHFDRKSYFYPDLPKGYQISQYQQPLVEGGNLMGVKITRIHLEEDTGTLSHPKENYSLVNFNRAGIPLMELVTEPDIPSAEKAVAFAKELQLILRYLGISEADMEKGQMRIEVNISLQSENSKSEARNSKLGTKVEIKNLNSFRAVKEAIEYEIKRQAEILGKGETVKQETRGWDDAKKITVSQRFKEESHDYRYFPEPDLPPLDLTPPAGGLPELPAERRIRFAQKYKLALAQIEILISDPHIAEYFEKTAKELKYQIPNTKYQILFNYLTSDLFGLMTEQDIDIRDLKISPKDFGELMSLIVENKISSRIAKDVLKEMFNTGANPANIIENKGLCQVTDESEIEKIIKEVIAKNPKPVDDYKKGKENAFQFLIGQVMAATKGRINPEMAKKLLKERLLK